MNSAVFWKKNEIAAGALSGLPLGGGRMKISRRQSLGNWAMLVVTVTAATASAIAVAQFRGRADQYRQTQLALTRVEGQIHRMEAFHARVSVAPEKTQLTAEETEALRKELLQLVRGLEADPRLYSALISSMEYASSWAQQPVAARPSTPGISTPYARAVTRLRQATADYEEAAQSAIWKSDVEATLGLLAFVVALAAILWRFGAARQHAKLAEAEQRVAEQGENRFRTLTEKSSDIIAILDGDGVIQYLSSSVEHVLGFPKQHWIGTKFLDLVHAEDSAGARTLLANLPATEPATAELRFRHANGNWCNMELFARNELGTTNVAGIVLNARDVTDRKRAEEQLVHDATHDALTQLPNRALFLDRLQRAVNRARRDPEYNFAVMFIDLDRFKLVNDTLGHLAGDRVLKHFARRLSGCLRNTTAANSLETLDVRRPVGDDTLARIGGDEFAILIEELRDVSDAIRVAQRILKRLETPHDLDGVDVYTAASIGIATKSTDYKSADEALRDADIAMFRAKTVGGSRFEVFDPAKHSQGIRRLQLESELRRALENHDFEVFYQPIVSLESSKVESIEALIRWRHKDHGLIPPHEFISIAEDTGMIVLIGRWVLREACEKLHMLQQTHPDSAPKTVSVNLSAKEFAQADLVENVRKILEETGLNPGSLRLEITESVAMNDVDRVASMLTELKKLGVRISIDDFGTGYSSLSYLRRFPIDTLKIDRSFVAAMDDSQESREIVRTIMTLANNLNMDVVAEGTETVTQIDELKTMACKYAQGFFFSRPLDGDALSDAYSRGMGLMPNVAEEGVALEVEQEEPCVNAPPPESAEPPQPNAPEPLLPVLPHMNPAMTP
jgi:diguanylate cyclase (GGDEF)-like protein/PAS domain S-box-containing protein